MKYPVVIHHDPGTAYGVTVPDIPGCFSAGETIDEALTNTQEAICGHLELLAEEGETAPTASNIEAMHTNPDYAGGIWAYVDIDITPFMGKSEKVNVTLPAFLIRKIDAAVAAGKGKNRSAFLAESAMRAL
jgi:predicted RNase H-like HicB family nuclease